PHPVRRSPADKRRTSRDEVGVSKAGGAPFSCSGEDTVRQVRRAYGVSRRVFSRLASFSERSIAAWESGGQVSGQGRQRMAELHRLREALAQVMDARSIATWLETPNPAFHEL